LKIDFFKRSGLNSIIVNEEFIVANTEGDGVQVYDRQGKFLRNFGEKEGLENLAIHKAMFDQYNNLWLSNDNGITFIEMSSSLTSYGPKQGVTAGVTEDLNFNNEDILLATHSGLYKSNVTDYYLSFKNDPVFDSPIYQIKKFQFSDGKNMQLVIGNEGIYYLSEDYKAEMIAHYVYAWDLVQSTSNQDRIYIGLDGDGVGSILYKDSEFIYEGEYKNTAGDVRSICEYNGEVYYTVKYEGVHVLDTTKEQSQNLLKGLTEYSDSTSNYEQFTLGIFNDVLYAGTAHGLYTVENDKLIPSKFEDGYFNEEKLLIHRIFNDQDGKMWIVMFHNSALDNETAELGYIEDKDGELVWNSSKFNQIKNDVIFSIKKAADGIYWLGGVKGVYAYNENTVAKYNMPFNVFINSVVLNEEEEYLFHTNYAVPDDHLIDYKHNTIQFEFGANAYLGGFQNEYAYYLEGEDENWSKWKNNTHVEYQRLGEGDYIFHLKARNFYGFESEETTFSFSISPPWYRTWWAYLIYVFLFGVLIFVIIKLSIRRIKAQNERLEEIVEERTAEIAEQNSQLEYQKAEIEEKTNDILDSIKYAKRIQTAILPPDDAFKTIFENEAFVLYKPKDIVSGDFYWADRFGSEAIFSAVDCTGHGVPGAFVSIVGFNGLNRTVNEFKLRDPGKILDKLTELVVGTFSKSESQIKDGMDIALCNINYDNLKLTYAGANNPLILIRNKEIIEVKANKQPIGEFENLVPFTTHEVQLQKDDCIFIYSDGFADQFGGPKGKKFKGKNLKELLLSLNDLSMKDQYAKLDEVFEEWKGDFEQLDDVCVIGVRI